MENSELFCTKCRSNNIVAGQKGFSIGKAVVGGAVLGLLGLIAGTHKSKDIKFTCLDCGNTFSAEELIEAKARIERENSEMQYRNSLTEEERVEYDKDRQKQELDVKIFAVIFFILAMVFMFLIMI